MKAKTVEKEVPERCHEKGGVVSEIIIFYKDKGFRYVICSPLFYESCEKHVWRLRERGIDFVKLNIGNDNDREWVKRIVAECYRAKAIIY